MADIRLAPCLMDGIACEAMVADKGYDSTAFIGQLLKPNATMTVVIPFRRNRLQPRVLDGELYKGAKQGGRFFQSLEALAKGCEAIR